MGQASSKTSERPIPSFQVGDIIPAARNLWFGRAAYTNEGRVVKMKYSNRKGFWLYKLDGNLRWMNEGELTRLGVVEGEDDVEWLDS